MKIIKQTEDALTQEFSTLNSGDVFVRMDAPNTLCTKIESEEYDDDDDDDPGPSMEIKGGILFHGKISKGVYSTLEKGSIYLIGIDAKIIKIDGEFVY